MANPLATLPGAQLDKLNTCDFTFTMAEPPNGEAMEPEQVQVRH